jgi:ComF family protein
MKDFAPRDLLPPLRRLGASALNLIWPAHSLLSREFVGRPGRIEPDQWAGLTFLTAPCCEACGFPFETDQGTGALCLACSADKPDFDRARAALEYDEASRKMVLDLKHGARRDGLPTFAAWMALAAPFVRDADLIIPIPLHRMRLIRRGYNQSAWLAQGLSARTGRPWSPQPLIRSRPTPSQHGLTAAGRLRNVHGAFRVNPDWKHLIHGKHIVLVDDVYTTGATVAACARALRRAGARQIDVACLMRVVRPQRIAI